MSETVPRQELEAAVRAHRELGPEYEDAIVDSIVEKIEARLAQREHPSTPRRYRGPELPLVLGSLGIAIPLMAIAGGTAGLAGIVVVSVAIVLVNYVASTRH